jgi:hypothetical protein
VRGRRAGSKDDEQNRHNADFRDARAAPRAAMRPWSVGPDFDVACDAVTRMFKMLKDARDVPDAGDLRREVEECATDLRSWANRNERMLASERQRLVEKILALHLRVSGLRADE